MSNHAYTRIAPLCILSLASLAASAADNPTFDAVMKGRKCKDENQQLVCEFHVGKSLRFAVVGIGQPDTAVTFYKADWDGDYYATYGLMHGCVIVKPGQTMEALSFAFVSPKNGKVYRAWEECRGGF